MRISEMLCDSIRLDRYPRIFVHRRRQAKIESTRSKLTQEQRGSLLRERRNNDETERTTTDTTFRIYVSESLAAFLFIFLCVSCYFGCGFGLENFSIKTPK